MNELVNVRFEEVRRYDLRTTCDRCKAEIVHKRGEVEQTTIQNESGDSWPEHQYTQFEGVDCCEACWDLVRAALVDLGFKIRAWDSERETRATYQIEGREHTFVDVDPLRLG